MPTIIRRHLWWIYVGVLVALSIGRLIERIAVDAGGVASRFGPVLFVAAIAVGILSWLSGKAILRGWLWRLILFLVVATQLIAIAFAITLARIYAIYPAIQLGAIALVLMPAAYAIFQYGWRTEELWRSTRLRE